MDNEKKQENINPSLDDKFLKTRSILISGEINSDAAAEFTKEIISLDSESDEPIYVYINSQGGDVYSGFAIHDMARYVTSPVYMIGEGLVASAAALIYLSVPLERRIALPYSTYLIHQPLSQTKGVAVDMQIVAEKIEALRVALDNLIADATGQSYERVHQDTERDCWLSAKEAIDYGIVSRIVKSKAEI